MSKSALALLDAASYPRILRELAGAGIGGGRTYDRLIGEAARAGGVAVLLTFNRRHFEPALAGVAIVEPAE